MYTDSVCYLTITQESKKSSLFSFDGKKWRDFLVKIRKVHDQLHDAGIQAEFLDKPQANAFVDRYFAMNFKDRIVSMTNFKVDDETVSMGGQALQGVQPRGCGLCRAALRSSGPIPI